MEDMQLLMDQISQLSQSLADSQMANVELEQTSTRTRELHDAMKVERDFMIVKSEQQEKEMNRLKEKMSFSSLDAINEQLKQVKAEAAEMQKENEALKQQNQILYQNYADIKSGDETTMSDAVACHSATTSSHSSLLTSFSLAWRVFLPFSTELQTLHDESTSKLSSLQQLLDEKSEVESARAALLSERDEAHAQVASLQAQVASLQSQADLDRAALESSRVREATEAREELARRLDTALADLHAMTTDRNRCKKVTESIQIDMKKMMAQIEQKGCTSHARWMADRLETAPDACTRAGGAGPSLPHLSFSSPYFSFFSAADSSLSVENRRLREDLARKSKSLQDALTALTLQMESASSPTVVSHETVVLAPASIASVGGRDLAALQTICNRLSETIKEKDDMVGVLRRQCAGLGRRVMELEAEESEKQTMTTSRDTNQQRNDGDETEEEVKLTANASALP